MRPRHRAGLRARCGKPARPSPRADPRAPRTQSQHFPRDSTQTGRATARPSGPRPPPAQTGSERRSERDHVGKSSRRRPPHFGHLTVRPGGMLHPPRRYLGLIAVRGPAPVPEKSGNPRGFSISQPEQSTRSSVSRSSTSRVSWQEAGRRRLVSSSKTTRVSRIAPCLFSLTS